MRKVDLEHNQVIVRGCKKLAQEEKKKRHDNVAKLVHWKLREKRTQRSGMGIHLRVQWRMKDLRSCGLCIGYF